MKNITVRLTVLATSAVAILLAGGAGLTQR